MYKFPQTTAPLVAQCLSTVHQFFADRYRVEVRCPRCGTLAVARGGPVKNSMMVVHYPAGWDTAEVNDYDGWKDHIDVDETTTEIVNMSTTNMFAGERVPTAYIAHLTRVSPDKEYVTCHRWLEEDDGPLSTSLRYERNVMKLLMRMGVVDPRPYLEKEFLATISECHSSLAPASQCALDLVDQMVRKGS